MTRLDAVLLAVCFLLLICPPKWDPLIRWKERRERPKPGCFNDYPIWHPQEAAERDCCHCLWIADCNEGTPYSPRPDGVSPPPRPTR